MGKTGIAIELAELIREAGQTVCVVNCDSMQVYAGLETISGAPSRAQREKVEHRLVSHVSARDTYSSGAFAQEAHREIDALLKEGTWPLVVGGTGLYLRAALSDLSLLPEVPLPISQRLEAAWDEEGPEAIHSRLPPRHRERVHPNDRKRVLRYLGLIEMGIEPHPDAGGGGRLWSEEMRHPTLLLGIVVERSELELAIDRRVDEMAAAGAVEEARRAEALGLSDTAAKAIGLTGFLEGDLESVRQSHLAFARRQMTWMRRMEQVSLIDRTGRSDREVAGEVFDRMQAEG